MHCQACKIPSTPSFSNLLLREAFRHRAQKTFIEGTLSLESSLKGAIHGLGLPKILECLCQRKRMAYLCRNDEIVTN